VNVMDVSTKLVADAAGSALASAGIPCGANVLEPLLQALLQVQDEQAATLKRIDANVQRLIDGPWETARTYMEEASLPTATPEQREDKLRNASAELHRAVSLQPESSLQRAYACLDLALVHWLLGDTASGVLMARRALESVTTCMVDDLTAIKKSKPTAVTRARWVAVGGLVAATRSKHKTKALANEFGENWQQYLEIQSAVEILCGAEDESLRESSDKLSATVTKFKLGKLMNTMTATV
jgi:hypothetical protein